MKMEVIERIRERAYSLWEGEGYKQDHDMEYWLRAEAESMGPTAGEADAHIKSYKDAL